jgi:hypothetical protein
MRVILPKTPPVPRWNNSVWGEAAPFAHLSEQDRSCAASCAFTPQLGDSLNGGKIQTMDRLIEEVAYEHWHRMLFARFLAENNLLMYPDPDDPVAVTLEECEDLAADEGAANGWELAARFAARMLPQIFRLDSPVFQLTLPPEHQQKLERLVADLELPVFTASDSLGWVYQFWQAKKERRVNDSRSRSAQGAACVTQLFTRALHGQLPARQLIGDGGRQDGHRGRFQNASAKRNCPGRRPLPVCRWTICALAAGSGTWTPAAGTFDGGRSSLPT